MRLLFLQFVAGYSISVPLQQNSPADFDELSFVRDTANFSKDPCDNFFEYSCGKWINSQPDDDDSSPFVNLQKATSKQLIESILAISSGDTPIKQTLRRVYQQCADEFLHGNSQLLKKQVEDFFNTVKMSTVEDKFDINIMLYQMLPYNIPTLIAFQVFPNPMHSKSSILMVDDAIDLISLPKEYYVEYEKYEREAEIYIQYIDNIFDLIGEDFNYTLPSMGKAIFALERKLANSSKSLLQKAANAGSDLPAMRLSELETKYPQFKWVTLLRISGRSPELIKFLETNPILLIGNPAYLATLEEILSTTPPADIYYYLLFLYVNNFSNLYDSRYRRVRSEYNKIAFGSKTEETCETFISKIFKNAASAVYVKDKKKGYITGIIDNIKNELQIIITTRNWMDNRTKEEAIAKLRNINVLDGFPDWIKDDDKLENHYKLLNVTSEDTYLQAVERLQSFLVQQMYQGLLEEADRTESTLASFTINAMYDPLRNLIDVPVVSYGGLGTIIGHELTHAFDPLGSTFDANGNLRNWWSAQAKQEFENRTLCFIEQYSLQRYAELGLNVNGEHTVTENVADSGGLRAAYMAFGKKFGERKLETAFVVREMNVSLTNEQLFFLSYGQTFAYWSKLDNVGSLA